MSEQAPKPQHIASNANLLPPTSNGDIRELTKEDERQVITATMIESGALELFAGFHKGHGDETFTPTFGKESSISDLHKQVRQIQHDSSGQELASLVSGNTPCELVVFSRAKETTDLGEVALSVEKRKGILGLLGIKKTEAKRVLGTVPKLLRNPLNDKEEPAVNILYRFKTDMYDEATHKAGNGVGAEVKFGAQLPESMANELKNMLDENPETIREIIDGFVDSEGQADSWNTQTQFTEEGNVLTDQGPAIWRRRPQYDLLPEDWNPRVVDATVPMFGPYIKKI